MFGWWECECGRMEMAGLGWAGQAGWGGRPGGQGLCFEQEVAGQWSLGGRPVPGGHAGPCLSKSRSESLSCHAGGVGTQGGTSSGGIIRYLARGSTQLDGCSTRHVTSNNAENFQDTHTHTHTHMHSHACAYRRCSCARDKRTAAPILAGIRRGCMKTSFHSLSKKKRRPDCGASFKVNNRQKIEYES
jgi:hypothetical protein